MVTRQIDEWSEAKCLQLIREYKRRPILWDPKHPFFYKTALKPAFWEEIGKGLKVDPVSCKHKMGVIKSSFRREKAKIMHSINDGDPEIYMSTWFAFNELSFLMDKDTEREQHTNVSSVDSKEDMTMRRYKEIMKAYSQINKTATKRPVQMLMSGANVIIKTVTENNDNPELDVTIDTHCELKKKAKKLMGVNSSGKSRTKKTDKTPSPYSNPSPSTSGMEESEDEIKSFTKFIEIKMKKYTENTKNAVQEAMCEVIFKADQNFYEDNYANITEEFRVIENKDVNVEEPDVNENDYSSNLTEEFCVLENTYDNVEEPNANENNYTILTVKPPRSSPRDQTLKTIHIEEDEENNVLTIKEEISDSE